MSKLVFDEVGKRFYETGVAETVLYPMAETEEEFEEGKTKYTNGVAWNGITSISESPSGAEANPFYADNIKYLNLISREDFGASIEAYTYPDEFAECDGSAELATGVKIMQQKRKMFGLCYKTRIGNDVEGDTLGYKLHLVYGVNAAPSERAYSTINESPEPGTMSWELTTTPVSVTGFAPTAHLEIDSRKANPEKLAKLLEALYGKDPTSEGGGSSSNGITPHLPMPDDVATLMGKSSL